jgi:hypothetical protein
MVAKGNITSKIQLQIIDVFIAIKIRNYCFMQDNREIVVECYYSRKSEIFEKINQGDVVRPFFLK